MQLIKNIPLPMAGLVLGLAATGNLLEAYGPAYRWGFGLTAMILFAGIILKLVMDPGSIREGFSNPAVASVMPTFSMSLILFAGYFAALNRVVAELIWYIGIALHLLMLVIFMKKHLLGKTSSSVLPSYFVVFVGIVTVSVTAPLFDQLVLGRFSFWFGLISFFALLPFVVNRVLVLKNLPEPIQPTITIMAAPASLLLAGYLKSFPDRSVMTMLILACFSLGMLAVVLAFLPRLLKLKFYPSYAAFTFPFAISAVAVKGLNAALIKAGYELALLKALTVMLEAAAVLIVAYVLMRYLGFLLDVSGVKRRNIVGEGSK